jgi:non-heme chloroperoxidase
MMASTDEISPPRKVITLVKNVIISALATAVLMIPPMYSQTFQTDANAATSSVQFVLVQDGVKLEVLDYGGIGRPMIFLAALGPDAHEWDKFAPKFKANHHVYAITRRGFGASDKPSPSDENYAADRLGDDVLAVMDKLKLDRPILVGHSVGGEELSSIGSRYPEKVAGLVYLDAGYSYAFYNSAEGNALSDQTELKRLVKQALQGPPSLEMEEKLLASIMLNEKELRASIDKKIKAQQAGAPKRSVAPPSPPANMPPPPAAMKAIVTNTEKYTVIPVPILAIYAVPHDLSKQYKDPTVRASEEAKDAVGTKKQVDAFEAGLPSAHVVRLAHADHYIFESNVSDVLREMNEFLAKLP